MTLHKQLSAALKQASARKTTKPQLAYTASRYSKSGSESAAAQLAFEAAVKARPLSQFSDTSGRFVHWMIKDRFSEIQCVIFDSHYRLDDDGIDMLMGAQSKKFLAQEVLSDPAAAADVRRLPGLPVGRVKLQSHLLNSDRVYTPHIGIDPAYQGLGLGGSLYRLALMQGAVLMTFQHSTDAKKLWDKMATLPDVTEAYLERFISTLAPTYWGISKNHKGPWSYRVLLGRGRTVEELIALLGSHSL